MKRFLFATLLCIFPSLAFALDGNGYAVVSDHNPTTQVWEASTGQYVTNGSAAYKSWIAGGGTGQQFQTTNIANNGSGACRITVASTTSLVTNDVWVLANTGTACDGTWPITVVTSATPGTIDLQGSAFGTGGMIFGVLDRGFLFPAQAGLFAYIDAFNQQQWAQGAYNGANVFILNVTTTLTNPMKMLQVPTAGSTHNLILPKMNLFGSLPKGVPFTISAQPTSRTYGVNVLAQDGVTNIYGAVIPGGLTVTFILSDNSTQNGSFVTQAAFSNLPIQPAYGGTGDTTLTAHGFLLGEGGAPVNATAAPTDAQLCFGQTGADCALATITGDFTVDKTGAGLLSSIITAGGPTGDASHVPQVTYDAKGRLTVVGSVAIAINDSVITYASQAANKVWAGPTSGAAAPPTFRLLVGADLPNPSATTLGGVESITCAASRWINQISTLGVPSCTQPATTDLSDYTGTGSWTPSDQSGAGLTFSSVTVGYTRIGNLVFVYGRFAYPATGDTSNMLIGGLPFTVANSNKALAPGAGDFSGSYGPCLLWFPIPNSTTMECLNNSNAIAKNNTLSGGSVSFQVFYPIN